MDVWEVFLNNETAIKRMCGLLAGNDTWLEDDLYTEAALRLPRIWDMHQPNVVKSLRILRWYLWKYRNKHRLRASASLDDNLVNNLVDETPTKIDVADEVANLMSGLEDWQKKLLLWRAEGFTLQEIGDCLGVCPCTVRKYVLIAIDKCLKQE